MHDLTQKEYQELLLEHSDFKHNIEDIKIRLERCENQQEAMSALTRSVDRLTITMGTMVEEHKELKKEVKSLKEAPAKKFEHYKKTLVSCIITTVVGALVGALISLVIINGGA